MKENLYSVAASGHERLVMAGDPGKALIWCLANDDVIAEADAIVITLRKDLVRLSAGTRLKARSEEVPAATGGADHVQLKELAEPLGLTPEGVRYRVKKLRLKTVRLDQHGRPLAVSRRDAERLRMDNAGE